MRFGAPPVSGDPPEIQNAILSFTVTLRWVELKSDAPCTVLCTCAWPSQGLWLKGLEQELYPSGIVYSVHARVTLGLPFFQTAKIHLRSPLVIPFACGKCTILPVRVCLAILPRISKKEGNHGVTRACTTGVRARVITWGLLFFISSSHTEFPGIRVCCCLLSLTPLACFL